MNDVKVEFQLATSKLVEKKVIKAQVGFINLTEVFVLCFVRSLTRLYQTAGLVSLFSLVRYDKNDGWMSEEKNKLIDL